MGGEVKNILRGNKDLIVEIKGWKINPLICYDLRFSFGVKINYSSNYKYDILIYVANWPAVRSRSMGKLIKSKSY